jgi:peroxiredoxin
MLGRPLPEFRGPALDGRSVDMALFRGRPVVVKFFAEYCEPCKRTLPAAQRLSGENPQVVFVGVSADDHASTARAIAARYALTFVVVHDRGRALQGRFRVRELPVTFVADSSGTVRWVGGAEQTEHDLERALRAVR